jgi:hypothetical protein
MIMTNLDGVEERKPFERFLALPGEPQFNKNVMSKEVAQYEMPPSKQYVIFFEADSY